MSPLWCICRSLTPLAQSGGAVMQRFGKWLTMLDAATAARLLGEAGVQVDDEGRGTSSLQKHAKYIENGKIQEAVPNTNHTC